MAKKFTLFLFFGSLLFAPAFGYKWKVCANIPGPGRAASASFVINNLGYCCSGTTSAAVLMNDLWMYNSVTDSWTQKANLPGPARYGARGFSINGLGYITNGWLTAGSIADLWEYNPNLNTWTQKNNFPATGRYHGFVSILNNKAYFGCGYSPYFNDLWEYNPATNTWTQKASFIGVARQNGIYFEHNGIGYFGLGANVNTAPYDFPDLYAYDPVLNSWIQKASMNGRPGRYGSLFFKICDRIYAFMGRNNANNIFSTFYEYDISNDSWSYGGLFPYSIRSTGIGMSLYNKGYLGTGAGASNIFYSDFYEYSFSAPVIRYQVQPCLNTILFFCDSTISNSTYQWNFGDGVTSTLQNPSHTYTAAGNFNVSVIASQSCVVDTSHATININSSSILDAIFSSAQVTCSGTVNFTNNSTGISGATNFTWHFGDGDTSNQFSPTHTYLTNGTFSVVLVAQNNCSIDSSVQTINYVNQNVNLSISQSIDSCLSQVTFANNSSGYSQYNWSFGDSTTSTSINPIHSYNSTGNYLVTLVASNLCHTDTFQITLNMNSASEESIIIPNAFSPNSDSKNDVFEINLSNNCLPLEIKIFNRWGSLIYANEISQPIKWDGKFQGTPCTESVYFYLCKIGDLTKSGTVTLFR